MQSVGLSVQTSFAELIERCLDASFDQDFEERCQFVKVTSKGRDYWYFQTYQYGGRTRRYVGPAAEPEITSRVERFKDIKADYSQRRDLVRALGQVLPRPDALTGDIVEALWRAGFFRLRGVLVGTVAFQAYAGRYPEGGVNAFNLPYRVRCPYLPNVRRKMTRQPTFFEPAIRSDEPGYPV